MACCVACAPEPLEDSTLAKGWTSSIEDVSINGRPELKVVAVEAAKRRTLLPLEEEIVATTASNDERRRTRASISSAYHAPCARSSSLGPLQDLVEESISRIDSEEVIEKAETSPKRSSYFGGWRASRSSVAGGAGSTSTAWSRATKVFLIGPRKAVPRPA
eukprot:TRINITY_DN8827_c0_g1_i2.p1 TRINITY_DN8827_c0_g1~~TRINITY_DN8827_c0_g1_i2.p1  ORF type:complete len:161 (-),score=24.64 TRINITY_DN8827_c0_g1_i2:316-798(-)